MTSGLFMHIMPFVYILNPSHLANHYEFNVMIKHLGTLMLLNKYIEFIDLIEK